MKTQTTNNDNKRVIKSLSAFDRKIIEVLRCLVPDQEMHLTGNGFKHWDSKCTQVDELAITTITCNGENIVKIVYDYDSSTEQEFWEVE